MDIETLKKERDDLLLALQQVKQWDINGWKERGFVLPTELRATIQALVAGASGRKCWNCAEVSEPCYDGGTPWCTKCGVVDNPSKPERPAAANAAGHSSTIWSAIENYAHASAVYSYGTTRADAAQQRQAKADARAELEALLTDRAPDQGAGAL